jgi:KUP system potassium uptake protein
MLDYLAQGSLILRNPAAVKNPFFLLLPGWAQMPMVVLAMLATVIASQAVISGAFSVTRQAMQLGFLPRLTIRQTSEHEVGQVYAPAVNTILFVIVIAIVLGFRSSNALASAYGVAVTGTFALNTILFLAVARFLWRKPKSWIALFAVVFLTIELTFFAANLSKVVKGGWLPLAIAALAVTLLTTWRKGRQIVTANRIREEGPIRAFVEYLDSEQCAARRVPGTAVFLNANPKTTPLAFRANVEHNHVIHEHVIIICIDVMRVPHVPKSERLAADRLGHPSDGITGILAHFGFQDDLDIPGTLRLAANEDLLEGKIDVHSASYFLSQMTIVATPGGGMSMWRKKLFLFMAHNAANPATYFKLPDDRTVTMGERIEL